MGGWHRDDPQGQVRIEVVLVADEAASPPVVYQVPLTHHYRALPDAEHAFVARVEDAPDGRGWVYDGPHDPAYVRDLLEQVLTRETDGPVPALLHASVLRGEQSDTSVICELEDADPVIVKVFRIMAPGPNPEVELPAGLYALGSRDVPVPRGSARAVWDGTTVPGYTASAQTFVPGVEDAWRVALRASTDGIGFTGPARELGQVTARIDHDLARAFPTRAATPDDLDRLCRSVRERFHAAVEVVPGLSADGPDVERLLAGLDEHDWPVLQRVHGDFHLGQVLHVGEHGWLALDFEGEPLRPLDERCSLTSRCVTWPACCARSTTLPARSRQPAQGSRAVTGLPPAAKHSCRATVQTWWGRRQPNGCSGSSSSTRPCTRSATRLATAQAGSVSLSMPSTAFSTLRGAR